MFKKTPRTIVVTIVQPRLPHQEGQVRSVEFGALDLLTFKADLEDAIAQVRFASHVPASLHDASWQKAYLQPSEKGCRWCPAAPKCPVLRNRAQEMAKQVFAPQVAYDPAQLAEILDFLPILEGWIKNTREFAYAEAEQGRVPPHYKLVAKRATRKWKADLAPELLASFLKVGVAEVCKPRELLGVAELEKLCPGKNKDERAQALEPYTVKESAGHTLVHESDPREGVRIDAKAAFS